MIVIKVGLIKVGAHAARESRAALARELPPGVHGRRLMRAVTGTGRGRSGYDRGLAQRWQPVPYPARRWAPSRSDRRCRPGTPEFSVAVSGGFAAAGAPGTDGGGRQRRRVRADPEGAGRLTRSVALRQLDMGRGATPAQRANVAALMCDSCLETVQRHTAFIVKSM
jgi:hypothetical protein